MLALKERISKNFINALGWRSKEKYILIESDDWGAIRMPSREVYDNLLKDHIAVDLLHFDKYDSVESESDLTELYNVLQSFKDRDGNHPVITAYYVVANPDFEKIEACDLKNYHYESILSTYSRFEHTKNVPGLIKDGIATGIFFPQYHGREHIQVRRWMEAINSNSVKEHLAFKLRAIISSGSTVCTNAYHLSYLAGLDYLSPDEFPELEEIYSTGLDMFEDIFGFKSLSFTAQGSIWGDHILGRLADKGVRLVGGQQSHPVPGRKYKFINKVWGTKNLYNQVHWRRNCLFEPSRNQDYNWVDKCLKEIDIAFRWNKPAVISSHRENFIGSVFESNRTESLQKLNLLLERSLKLWPDVRFISTHQLAERMVGDYKL